MDNQFNIYKEKISRLRTICLIVLVIQILITYNAYTQFIRESALIIGSIFLVACGLNILCLVLLIISENKIFTGTNEELEVGLRLYGKAVTVFIFSVICSTIVPIIGIIISLYVSGIPGLNGLG